jgi:hypothetical protein
MKYIDRTAGLEEKKRNLNLNVVQKSGAIGY